MSTNPNEVIKPASTLEFKLSEIDQEELNQMLDAVYASSGLQDLMDVCELEFLSDESPWGIDPEAVRKTINLIAKEEYISANFPSDIAGLNSLELKANLPIRVLALTIRVMLAYQVLTDNSSEVESTVKRLNAEISEGFSPHDYLEISLLSYSGLHGNRMIAPAITYTEEGMRMLKGTNILHRLSHKAWEYLSERQVIGLLSEDL